MLNRNLQVSIIEEQVYTSEKVQVRTRGNNIELPIEWSIEKDGESADISTYVTGKLENLGREIQFTEGGSSRVIGTIRDGMGRTFTSSDTIKVLPVGPLAFSMSDREYVGNKVPVVMDKLFNPDGAAVAWSVQKESAASAWVSRTIAFINSATVITPFTASATRQTKGDQFFAKVSATGSDPDGDTMKLEWDGAYSASGWYSRKGSQTIRVRAVDFYGAASPWQKKTIKFVNQAPSKPDSENGNAKTMKVFLIVYPVADAIYVGDSASDVNLTTGNTSNVSGYNWTVDTAYSGFDSSQPGTTVANVRITRKSGAAMSADLTIPVTVKARMVLSAETVSRSASLGTAFSKLNLPSTVSITAEGGKTVTGVPVTWSSTGYNANTPSQTIQGTLNVSAITELSSTNLPKATANITLSNNTATTPAIITHVFSPTPPNGVHSKNLFFIPAQTVQCYPKERRKPFCFRQAWHTLPRS